MKGPISVPDSVSDLKLTRERSRNEINDFLESDMVDHKLGGIPGWKAAFGARHKSNLIAVCVLGRPVARNGRRRQRNLNYTVRIATRKAIKHRFLANRSRPKVGAFLEGYQRISLTLE